MIPDFQTIMLPLLEILSDGKEHSIQSVVNTISDLYKLSEEERNKYLESGNQRIIDNRVGWARTYLKKANLIKPATRGVFVITDDGLNILRSKPKLINIKFLETLEPYKKWVESYSSKTEDDSKIISEEENETKSTPQELLEFSSKQLREELAFELLEKIKICTPTRFEQLVIELLVKMGYGKAINNNKHVGRSGDGGIDGIIYEDKLGLDGIYIQAKKWDSQVDIKSVRDFAGALQSQKANKGVFITTSTFPKSAEDFVKAIPNKIILINGEELARLMIDYNLGVTLVNVYEEKKLNNSFFED